MQNVLSIEELFSSRVFRVPDYQRGYAWEARQLEDLLEDLELLSIRTEHYGGTVVLHRQDANHRKVDSEGKSHAVYDIVDGQQRLATLVILLDCIRWAMDGVPELDQSLPRGIRRAYVVATQITGEPLYKLSMNSDSDHFFRTTVLDDCGGPEGPQISSERRLEGAKRMFTTYIAGQRDTRGTGFGGWLTDLYLAVATRFQVTLYEVESDSEVGMIFELMNNRGKPLSELEKVKNYLLYAASTVVQPSEAQRTVNDAWSEILRQLMAAGLTTDVAENQLLRAHWLAYYDPRPRVFDGYRSIKDEFDLRKYGNKGEELLAELQEYAETLRAAAVCFCDAQSPSRAAAFNSIAESARSEVQEWSARLREVNVLSTFLPLLIGTRMRYPADAAKYLQAVRLCEVFAMRAYRLLGRRSDAGEKELIPLGYRLRRGEVDWERAMLEVADAIKAYAPLQSLRSALEVEQDWYDWGGLKYFLYQYEEHLAGRRGAPPRVGWEEIRDRDRQDTIEHVLPQAGSDDYWTQRFSPEEHRRLVHDLGNLTLTKDNSTYSNKSFPEKRGAQGWERPCYAESPLFTERELSQIAEWTPAEVGKRRRRLVEWAEGRWGLGHLEEVDIVPEPMDADESAS